MSQLPDINMRGRERRVIPRVANVSDEWDRSRCVREVAQQSTGDNRLKTGAGEAIRTPDPNLGKAGGGIRKQ